MREINSFYGITGDGETAVIEMAAASGIELLKELGKESLDHFHLWNRSADQRMPWIGV